MPRRKQIARLVCATSGHLHDALVRKAVPATCANQVHHVFVPGSAAMLQCAAVRRTIRPDSLPWLPFLMGSGAGAIAFLSLSGYERRPSYTDGRMGTLQHMSSVVPSLFHWPWRTASASGSSDVVLAHGGLPHTQQLPGLSRPPPLPPSHRPAAMFAESGSQQQPAASSTAPGGSDNSPFTRQSISEAAAKASPSVVHLVVTDGVGIAPASFMSPARSTGSGILYHEDGFILTNAHVVMAASGDGPNLPPLLVMMHDGRMFRGRVISMDKWVLWEYLGRTSDLAVVKVDSKDPLPAAEFGSSSDLQLGAWVVALGSPLMLKHSVTAGIVSCVSRRGAELGLTSARTEYIQTDAAVNLGSSGGPLCNLDGEVVGINNMKAVAASGVSFAIPADAVREIVRQFHLHGRVIRPYIGISMIEVANGGLKQLREQVPAIPPSSQSAVMIQKVVEGSPAMEAGLKPDDLLISVAGKEHLSMSRVVEEFAGSIGKGIELQVLRRGEDGEYKVVTRHLVPVEAPS